MERKRIKASAWWRPNAETGTVHHGVLSAGEMLFDRRAFLTGSAALLSAQSIPRAATMTEVRPEDFGARGDGRTNDTVAFAAMSAYVSRLGAGRILLRRTTYLVGLQSPSANDLWSFEPAPIMDLRGLSGALRIEGNGARLTCAPDLRYGAFDRQTGTAVDRTLPNLRPADRASPYVAMIHVRECSGPVEISDLELDGRAADMRLGGVYGDTGRQIPATGLFLQDNWGPEIVRNIRTHGHALDGVMIDGLLREGVRSRFENVICDFNGRQGMSIIGGHGYDFIRCAFTNTGQLAFSSAPGAGVDIEAEGGKLNRDFTFSDCLFRDNAGVGLVADSGDSADIAFTRCMFMGSRSWAAWPNKPAMRFSDSTFVGALVRTYSSGDFRVATRFSDCDFLDAWPDDSGRPYLGGSGPGPIANLDDGENVRFDRCRFPLTSGGELPWSRQAIYADCAMFQRSERQSYPRGIFLGRTTIAGNAVLTGSHVIGEVVLNGRRFARTRL